MKIDRSFVFVDLAGFTALTEAHGDESAAELAGRFHDLARSIVSTSQGDAFVRPIGDAVMLAFEDPRTAVSTVRELLEVAFADQELPLLRVGMHHGDAVERGGDHFGAAVNLAARITNQARGGQVLATEMLAEAASAIGHEVIDLGAFRLRNVRDEVALYELLIGPSTESGMIDPVCRMWIDRDRAAGRLRFEHHDHWFCSLGCVERFAADPTAYVTPEGSRQQE